MLKEKIEAMAISNGWQFVYARRDYQNLTDVLDFVDDAMEGYGVGETFLFMDPIKYDGSKTDGITYSGTFMVLTKSDLDDDYESKYIKYVEPLKTNLLGSFKNQLRCDFSVNAWGAIEVINVFDLNADGLNITYNLKG